MTKYELWSCQSHGDTESMMPVSPAMRNWNRNPMQNSIGVVKRIRPPHRVAIQLKILIPVGTPTSIVDSVKKAFETEVMPTVNMWCAHTLRLTNMIATEPATIAGYPKIALRQKTGMISFAMANAGKTRT